jgi:hypothetical protein
LLRSKVRSYRKCREGESYIPPKPRFSIARFIIEGSAVKEANTRFITEGVKAEKRGGRAVEVQSAEADENGFHEISDEELHVLVDLNARELVGISGEEFLGRLREKNPVTDDVGCPVPGWGPVAMLADLLNR